MSCLSEKQRVERKVVKPLLQTWLPAQNLPLTEAVLSCFHGNAPTREGELDIAR